MLNADLKLLELQKTLHSSLLTFVRAVVNEQLETTGEEYIIGYGPDWRDGCELHVSVMKKFGIRVCFVDKKRSDSQISMVFELTGKLGELFKRFDIAPFIHARLQDNGEDFFNVTCNEDVCVLEHCTPLFVLSDDLEKYSTFVNAVSKQLLLTTVQYSGQNRV